MRQGSGTASREYDGRGNLARIIALQHEAGLRERWRFAFTDGITMLRHLLQHPGFLAMNELSMTKDEYRAYIEQRVERFEALKRRYEAISGT
jgi:hypothetical protein